MFLDGPFIVVILSRLRWHNEGESKPWGARCERPWNLVQIAEGSRNLEMAKALVENLLDDAKFQHQQAAARFPTAQQLRDALSPVYNALGGGAKQFIGDVIDWLRSEHLGRSDSGTAS
jgi:hypothetical protein